MSLLLYREEALYQELVIDVKFSPLAEVCVSAKSNFGQCIKCFKEKSFLTDIRINKLKISMGKSLKMMKSLLPNNFLCLCVCMCVFLCACVCLCVCVWMCLCVCVSVE